MVIPSETRPKSSAWVLQFINIVFLILLFFMVGGTIAETPNPDILPPITLQSSSTSPPQDALYIDANGEIRFHGQVLALEGFVATVAKADEQFSIVADRRLPAHVLLKIIAKLNAAGLIDLKLITVKTDS